MGVSLPTVEVASKWLPVNSDIFPLSLCSGLSLADPRAQLKSPRVTVSTLEFYNLVPRWDDQA